MYRKNRLLQQDKKHLWHPFTQMHEWEQDEPLVIESGKGCFLKDLKGRKYIDGVSSLWVNVHGHRKRELDRAIIRQLGKVAHTTLLGLSSIPSIELAGELVRIAPPGLTRVFYSDDGSTAVEVALKLAFQFWHNRGGTYRRKRKFIRFKNAYHGDTLGAVSVGGIDLFHDLYHPLLFDTIEGPSFYCYRCEFGKEAASCDRDCLAGLQSVTRSYRDEIAAMIIEPLVQGAGGMIVAPSGHLAAMERLCRENNILLIADEVAVGFGRTGKMFACENERVSPDILVLSKGITGGYLPLAATLTTEKVYRAFCAPYRMKKTFFHGHSYTGNALACAVSLANLTLFRKERILEKLLPKIKIVTRLLKIFRDLPHVGDVRQCGFMAGIELVRRKKNKVPYPYSWRMGHRICMRARRYGLILRPLGDVIVIMPPLSIPERHLRRMIGLIYRCIREETE